MFGGGGSCMDGRGSDVQGVGVNGVCRDEALMNSRSNIVPLITLRVFLLSPFSVSLALIAAYITRLCSEERSNSTVCVSVQVDNVDQRKMKTHPDHEANPKVTGIHPALKLLDPSLLT